MRKIIVSRPGGPEVLEMVTSMMPPVTSGQVLVDVEAAGVNYLDVNLRHSALSFSEALHPVWKASGR